MCIVPALCIDHIEHEEDYHARACPLRGDMYEEKGQWEQEIDWQRTQ